MNTDKYLAGHHERSLRNKAAILVATTVGCFHCCQIYPASEVKHFTSNTPSDDAWCPKCGIDAVLVEDGANEFSMELLQALKKRYFNATIWAELGGELPISISFSFTEIAERYHQRTKNT